MFLMAIYQLQHLGIGHDLDIDGTLTELPGGAAGQPIVFLIDEYHETPGQPLVHITQNIANVEELCRHASIGLIGVESHYMSDVGMGGQCNNCPRFADYFHTTSGPVWGMESPEVYDMMIQDLGQNPTLAAIAPYPMNYLRSYYYVAALFRRRHEEKLQGNMVLNSGKIHIDHIVQLHGWGGIGQLAGMTASYVRIRSTAYPN
jgi:hypothetical protein